MSFERTTDLWARLERDETESLGALTSILSYMRPHGSKSEHNMIRNWIVPLGGKTDGAGNIIVRVGERFEVAWTAHTDTVHPVAGYQKLARGANNSIVRAPDRQRLTHGKKQCLGADDAAGIWLMREMILAGKPGLYIFQRAEELGGIGSNYIVHKTPQILDGIRAVVSLDRGGHADIITHQMGARCASDAFASSIADQIPGFRASSEGIFSDSANYTDLIGECSNLSVGYSNAHSPNESLDVAHLYSLRAMLLSLEPGALKYDRAPGETDSFYGLPYGNTSWPLYRSGASNHARVAAALRDDPDAAADYLIEQGIDVDSLEEWLAGGRY